MLHDVGASVIEHDILVYMQAKLGEISERFKISTLSDWPSDDDIQALVKKSGKPFIYAVISGRFIGDELVYTPRTQLDGILRLQEATEATLFVFLDKLYLQLDLTGIQS